MICPPPSLYFLLYTQSGGWICWYKKHEAESTDSVLGLVASPFSHLYNKYYFLPREHLLVHNEKNSLRSCADDGWLEEQQI